MQSSHDVAPPDDLTFFDVLRFIIRRWKIMAVAVAVSGGLTFGYLKLMVAKKFQVTAVVALPADAASLFKLPLLNAQTCQRLADSKPVRDQVSQQLKDKNCAPGTEAMTMRTAVSAAVPTALELTVEAATPETAAQVVNEWADALQRNVEALAAKASVTESQARQEKIGVLNRTLPALEKQKAAVEGVLFSQGGCTLEYLCAKILEARKQAKVVPPEASNRDFSLSTETSALCKKLQAPDFKDELRLKGERLNSATEYLSYLETEQKKLSRELPLKQLELEKRRKLLEGMQSSNPSFEDLSSRVLELETVVSVFSLRLRQLAPEIETQTDKIKAMVMRLQALQRAYDTELAPLEQKIAVQRAALNKLLEAGNDVEPEKSLPVAWPPVESSPVVTLATPLAKRCVLAMFGGLILGVVIGVFLEVAPLLSEKAAASTH